MRFQSLPQFSGLLVSGHFIADRCTSFQVLMLVRAVLVRRLARNWARCPMAALMAKVI